MNDLESLLLAGLLRSTVILSLAAVLLRGLLWLFKARSPRVHRIAACLVLLQGWMLAQWSFEIPYLAAPVEEPTTLIAAGGEYDLAAALSPADTSPAAPSPADASPADLSPADTWPTTFPAASLAEPADVFPWRGALLMVWLSGMAAVVLCQAIAYYRFVRSLPSPLAAEGTWVEQWQALQRQAGVKEPIAFQATEAIGPMLCRLPGGYRLLAPRALWRCLSSAQRAAILQHELAHFRRRDVWTSLAVRVLALPQWFNPLAWSTVRHFDQCAEWACDGEVGKLPSQVTDYARALLLLGDEGGPGQSFSPAAGGRGLAFRIQRLLAPHSKEDSRMKTLLIVTSATVLLALGLARFELVAQQPAVPDGDGAVPPSAPIDAAADTQSDPVPPTAGDVSPSAPMAVGCAFFSERSLLDANGSLSALMTVGCARCHQQAGDGAIPPRDATSARTSYLKRLIGLPADDPLRSYVVVQQQQPRAGQRREAIVDLAYVYQHYEKFQQQIEKLKKDIRQAEFEMKRQREEYAALQESIKLLEPNTPARQLIEAELQRKLARMRAQPNILRKKMILQEATIYDETFKVITDEIARYAKEHGIRLVRRSKHLSRRITPAVVSAELTDDFPFDADAAGAQAAITFRVELSEPDAPVDPTAILKRLNREVLYEQRDEIDITEPILKRLNRWEVNRDD